MIRSMTGFGSAATEEGGLRISATVRSVNHRFLEVHCQLPRRLSALENEIKDLVHRRFARGRLEVNLGVPTAAVAGSSVTVNRPLILSLVGVLRGVQEELGIGGELRVGDVTRFPGVLEVVETDVQPGDDLKSRLLAVLDSALEGLLGRVEQVERATVAIEAISAGTRAARIQSLTERTAELRASLGLDEVRLYQEIVRAVERHDVSEETERLRSHVSMVRSLVLGPEAAVGKRLDFLAQELMREANTIGSKAADAALVQTVVDLKADVERFREQVQNAE
jgi:uncharacterized protein (TIGR00255 family)